VINADNALASTPSDRSYGSAPDGHHVIRVAAPSVYIVGDVAGEQVAGFHVLDDTRGRSLRICQGYRVIEVGRTSESYLLYTYTGYTLEQVFMLSHESAQC
jgi:hypothetical protein